MLFGSQVRGGVEDQVQQMTVRIKDVSKIRIKINKDTFSISRTPIGNIRNPEPVRCSREADCEPEDAKQELQYVCKDSVGYHKIQAVPHHARIQAVPLAPLESY